MSSDRERIIEFDAATTIPADGWFAIDSTTEGTRKVQKSAIIGSGTLDTTSQEVVGAINEVNARAATVESMTQAEYDALPDTKLSDNVVRYITDGEPTYDETLWNKVGEDPLDTTAQDCSGAINEIKSALSVLNDTLTFDSTYISTNYDNSVYKMGGVKFVNIILALKAISNINNWYDIANLPSGYTNINTVETDGFTRANKAISFRVNSGKLQMCNRATISSGDIIAVQFMYV